MVFVYLNEDESKVLGTFNFPQSEPAPQAYAVIEDDDVRLKEFLNNQQG